MTDSSLIRILTPGCHQNALLNIDTVLTEPLPIGIHRNLIYPGQMSLRPGFHVTNSESLIGSRIETENSTRGRR